MKLYFHPVSTTSRPVALFAADHGIELDYQLVDLFVGEHLQPAFTAVNAHQAVPVLEDGELRLTESSAILKYLADKIGSPAYPRELQQRARINERMDWFNTSLSRELCYGFLYPQLMPTHKREDERAQRDTLDWARRNASRWLSVLNDNWLGGDNRYVCGERITIADYLGIAYVTVGEAARVDYSRWPNLSRWIDRMKDRPSWARVNEAFYTYLVQPHATTRFETL
ncbi:MAG TPA: glutathione S-transferase family protein [Steroidobacteraceae bacterium]|nr:glutathione S-transferase family protein [Steroidobacteraceae bacterium]